MHTDRRNRLLLLLLPPPETPRGVVNSFWQNSRWHSATRLPDSEQTGGGSPIFLFLRKFNRHPSVHRRTDEHETDGAKCPRDKKRTTINTTISYAAGICCAPSVAWEPANVPLFSFSYDIFITPSRFFAYPYPYGGGVRVFARNPFSGASAAHTAEYTISCTVIPRNTPLLGTIYTIYIYIHPTDFDPCILMQHTRRDAASRARRRVPQAASEVLIKKKRRPNCFFFFTFFSLPVCYVRVV